jgi:hypothetical protein
MTFLRVDGDDAPNDQATASPLHHLCARDPPGSYCLNGDADRGDLQRERAEEAVEATIESSRDT